jgi:hypothetical protein
MSGDRRQPAVPVACTLAPGEVPERISRWRRALVRSVTGAERPDPSRLRLRLHEDPADVAALVLLARQEKDCCAFFEFSFVVEHDATVLVVDVPGTATEILDGFAGLVGPARCTDTKGATISWGR